MYILVGRPTEDLTMKKIWRNDEGVSPVIAVILMVAITVVLAAVLYVMVSGMMTGTTTAPTGALSFTENTVGNYTGGVISLSDTVKVSDASVTIIDISTGNSKSLDPLASGTAITPGAGELSVTYTDSNANLKIDAGDVWTVTNGAAGDIIKLIHKTGKSVAEYTLT
jgi:flagellin-like protein